MKKFIKWLGIQEALEKGLIARILVILCLLYIIFGIVFVTIRIVMTLSPALPDAHWTDMLIESMILLIGLFTLWLIRKDRMRAASRVILGCLLLAVSMQAYFIGDPANDVAGAMGLLLFAILAILILDRWDRWIAVFLVVCVIVGLNIMAASGNLLPAVTLTPMGKTYFSFFIWLTVSMIISVLLVAAMGAMRREPQLLQQRIAESDLSGDGGVGAANLPYLSTHDDLTGLYNRLFFETEFTRLEKSRLFPISIIIADLDGMKKVNETFGLKTGDQLMINVARLFTKVFRQEDIVCRYGDDEFAVLLPDTDPSIVQIIMSRIEKQIDDYNKGHVDLPIRISIGTSTAAQGESLKNHLKLARKFMLQEKTKHKS